MPQRTNRPRVIIVTRSVDRASTSGSGHHQREMVRHLIPQADDLDILLAHYQHSDDEIYRMAPDFVLPLGPLRAARVLNRYRPDVVHFSPLSMWAPIHGLGAKKVATIHSAEPIMLPEGYSLAARLHERLVAPRYARAMDVVCTVSEASKRWFAEHFLIDMERMIVTYNACAPAYRVLDPEQDRLRNPDDPPVDTPFILHVSRFSLRKNPWTMLEAFARVVTRQSGVTGQPLSLVLAGSGWNNPEIQRRARERGIAERIHLPGFVSEDTVVRLMNRAEVFWFPSLSEGFGMPNIEAMTCGCPVVTSAVHAIPEIVGDAAVVLDDPRDVEALASETERILTSPGWRADLVERGLERARRYDWNASAHALANCYRRLTGLPERAAPVISSGYHTS